MLFGILKHYKETINLLKQETSQKRILGEEIDSELKDIKEHGRIEYIKESPLILTSTKELEEVSPAKEEKEKELNNEKFCFILFIFLVLPVNSKQKALSLFSFIYSFRMLKPFRKSIFQKFHKAFSDDNISRKKKQ